MYNNYNNYYHKYSNIYERHMNFVRDNGIK